MPMRKSVLMLVLVCFAALAQIEQTPRVGVGVIKKEISLGEAIELALRNNLEIEIEKTNISSASAAVPGAKGFLDPRFRWSPLYEDRQTPTSSALIGIDGRLVETIGSQNFSWDQKLPWWGSAFSVRFENNRQTTTNPFITLSPFQVGRFSANVSLPLVRNRAVDRDRANLKISNKQVSLSETQFELKVIGVIGRVEEAYWNLVAARQNVEVTAEAVNLGREQLARTRRMIDSGTLPPVEIAAAEAELERRVDTWFASIGLVTEIENALKVLITESREDPLWNDEIIPTEERTLPPPEYDQVHAAVDVALHKRPELRQVGLQLESNQIQSQLARDQTRPQLDFVGGYAVAGLAGNLSDRDNPFSKLNQDQFARINELSAFHDLKPLPPPALGGIPIDQIGGIGAVMSAITGARYPTIYAGLQLDFTARNRTAEAQLSQAAIAERRLRLQRSQVEQSIEAQVRNALQAIQTARQRITAAEASERAAREKLDSEIRLFQSGESTNFLVLTRQNELSDSRRRAVVARLDFNKAVAQVQQALGTTLETYNVQLQ